ncbi:MAG: alpha-glucosidase [Lachnospiraceae bacterium]|nr:alpha-glucosidase [Lachnospiraceae bacterium]
MQKKWWHDKVAYQIYPKSFYDSNGDGIGDLCGIISKLDYLKDLGIDIIWISPVYPSPMVDNGYDISDYYGIDPRFGTMEDMDRLIEEAKKRDMAIIMDLVVNHCSNEHEWFKKACEDPYGPYGKYFYIREMKDQKEPNNWRSVFGGSVWEKLPGNEDLCYLHFFAPEQPDLNWENPLLREEIYKMINFWLDKGIAGFRIDAIINIKKDLTWEDLPVDGPDQRSYVGNSIDRLIDRDGGTKDGIGVFLRELRERCFTPHDSFTVGEVFNMRKELMEEFIGKDGYFSSMFAFETIQSYKKGNCWYDYDRNMDPDQWKKAVFESQKLLSDNAFEATIIENHDQPRGASLYIPRDEYGFASVSALAGLQLLQRGIPFLYQGQEIGMTNCPFELEEYDDINTIDSYQFMIQMGRTPVQALDGCYRESRDNTRTPMQWDDSENAGFTTGKPWLKVNPNYLDINVAKQEKEYGSILNYYKRLIAFRKSKEYGEILTWGSFEPMYENQEKIFAFKRKLEEKELTVICNFSDSERFLVLKEDYSEVVFVNLPQVTRIGDNMILRPYQLIVVEK